MEFYTDTELSPNQRFTPEGFLVCTNVAIGRTGVQFYHPAELPDLDDDGRGYIAVQRDPDEVFCPTSMASYEGKPITDDHPPDMITPMNWSRYALGHVANVRRGTGTDADVLLADLVFTTQHGIQLVRGGKRQVSVGYTANYQRTDPGNARQCDIRANHLSLVSEARCGPRCSIGDAMHRQTKGTAMPALARRRTTDVAPLITAGPQPILRLSGPATTYSIRTYGNDETWLCQHSLVEGSGDPGVLGLPPRVPQATGDALLDRANRMRAERDRSAALGAALNEKATEFWKRH